MIRREFKPVASKPDIVLQMGGSTTRPISRDGGAEQFHGDPRVWLRLKVWTRGQKWK